MRALIFILTLVSLTFSQTINDLNIKDISYFEKFEYWYTGAVAGDSSAHHFKLYQKNRINHAELALKHFKSAYSFAQKNDKYNLSNSSINFYFINQLIKTNVKENTLLAEKKISAIKFANERNVYVKRFLNVKAELITELKTRQKRFKIDTEDEADKTYKLDELRSDYYYSILFRVNNGSNTFKKEAIRLINSNNRLMELESPSLPIGLGFNFGNNIWKFAFSYDISFLELTGKVNGYDVTHGGYVSLISLDAYYMFYNKENFNLYAMGGLDQYNINFGELNKNQTKTGSNGVTSQLKFKAPQKTESSLGFNFGAGIEYYLGKDTSAFGNFTMHNLFSDLEYTETSFSYISVGFLYHIY